MPELDDRHRQAEGRGHRTDRGRQQGPVAGRVLLGLLRRPRMLRRHAARPRSRPCRRTTRASSRPAMTSSRSWPASRSRPAFLDTPAQIGAGSSAGLVATGKAAMELQGDWDPSVFQALVSKGQWQSDTTDLGWFPFPAVPGAPGNAQALLGGSDGNSCSTNAPSRPAPTSSSTSTAPRSRSSSWEPACCPPTRRRLRRSRCQPISRSSRPARARPSSRSTSTSPTRPTSAPALDTAVANFFANPGKTTPQSIVTAIDQAAAQQ